jgi:hypothetical protein
LLPILSELLPPTTPTTTSGQSPSQPAGTMRIYAMAELAVIARGWQRFKAQGELMRVVGARIEDGNIVNVNNSFARGTATTTTTTSGMTAITSRGQIGGRGMSILPHRFNPGVSLSQVIPVPLSLFHRPCSVASVPLAPLAPLSCCLYGLTLSFDRVQPIII